MSGRFLKYILILLSGVLASSCAPTKEAAILKHDKVVEQINIPDKVYYIDEEQNQRIEVGDELFISVSSGNDEPNSFNQTGRMPVTDMELLSYVVDSEGRIKMPYIQQMKLAGLTLNEAVDTLQAELSQYLYMPSVNIRFINGRVSILGEVNSPGVYVFNRKSINIYQAIAYAGDITSYGNRKNIMIVRQEGDTVLKKYIDITNSEIINSDWYSIQANDIIYVESLGRKIWGMETFPYGLVFSLLSTTMMVITFSISLYN
ncbi:MAG: polysaccharide biosynthesis/export family protein [Bacteroidota bacterium]